MNLINCFKMLKMTRIDINTEDRGQSFVQCIQEIRSYRRLSVYSCSVFPDKVIYRFAAVVRVASDDKIPSRIVSIDPQREISWNVILN